MAALLIAAVLTWSFRSAAPPGVSASHPRSRPAPRLATPFRLPELLKVKVLATRHHDPAAFTQGLLVHEGSLYESTGLYGSSSLREVDPVSGAVKRKVDVPSEFFAEGLALVDDRLIQLTWKEQKALVYKLDGFASAGDLRYEGEGWGLCWDGKRLVMTDGSDKLTFRDPTTFAFLGEVTVTRADRMGERVLELNELECVDGVVYANVWQTDEILRIDPLSGRVTAVIDASGLLTPEERQKADVLNGIAWDPQRKIFLITGKLWPKLFEVTFVSAVPAAPGG
ncbi:MAG TPA: glutaminyl-peptide cyclotransferase [Thermoanaerobaculia bacterium]|jgi:glutaminyl-peptide cyclotransferase|nr:glutaminyl-peptide cyclotransferase [Thermoanaerobaculia bacterium]